ncbi:MAG: hypothetical protein RMI94_08245 [Bryobacterales bacterium]|nr:hypothetical protein [Bryobacteraceae bacterium]MDW8130525.1 hypothetical protein [Bryobacterales bacterium]
MWCKSARHRLMAWLCAGWLTWTAALLRAGSEGGRAQYVGGTTAALKANIEGRILTTDHQVFEFRTRLGSITVPYEKINLLEYGQQASRRYALGVIVSPVLLLSKKRKHFLTIGYRDEQDRQQAMVFRVDKRDIRAVLAALEARTGRRVEFQDEEARKAGRGGG